jgi:hypothetical protein
VRILREIAEQIEVGREYGKSVPIHDINGNAVGSFIGRINCDHKRDAGEDSAATPYRHDSIEPRSSGKLTRRITLAYRTRLETLKDLASGLPA